jgi:hypothetical protein
MIDVNGLYKYSNVVLLNASLDFDVKNLMNPFKDIITADVIMPKEGMLGLSLYNDKGQLLKSLQVPVIKGINNISLENINIPNGVYYLSLNFKNETIKRKLVKIN